MFDIAVVPAYFRSCDPKLKLNMVKGIMYGYWKLCSSNLLLHLFKGEIELYKPHIQYLWNENNNNTYS